MKELQPITHQVTEMAPGIHKPMHDTAVNIIDPWPILLRVCIFIPTMGSRCSEVACEPDGHEFHFMS